MKCSAGILLVFLSVCTAITTMRIEGHVNLVVKNFTEHVGVHNAINVGKGRVQIIYSIVEGSGDEVPVSCEITYRAANTTVTKLAKGILYRIVTKQVLCSPLHPLSSDEVESLTPIYVRVHHRKRVVMEHSVITLPRLSDSSTDRTVFGHGVPAVRTRLGVCASQFFKVERDELNVWLAYYAALGVQHFMLPVSRHACRGEMFCRELIQEWPDTDEAKHVQNCTKSDIVFWVVEDMFREDVHQVLRLNLCKAYMQALGIDYVINVDRDEYITPEGNTLSPLHYNGSMCGAFARQTDLWRAKGPARYVAFASVDSATFCINGTNRFIENSHIRCSHPKTFQKNLPRQKWSLNLFRARKGSRMKYMIESDFHVPMQVHRVHIVMRPDVAPDIHMWRLQHYRNMYRFFKQCKSPLHTHKEESVFVREYLHNHTTFKMDDFKVTRFSEPNKWVVAACTLIYDTSISMAWKSFASPLVDYYSAIVHHKQSFKRPM